MNQCDASAFAELITDVLAFYGQKVSQFGLSVWWEACRPFEYEAVRRALSRHAMDPERGQFSPKPADLVRQMKGTPSDRAAKAWSLVMDAASRVGAYTDVVFDDQIIHAVVEDMGGWVQLCRSDIARISYQQHRFHEAYSAYCNRGDLVEWPRKLRGDRSPDDVYLSRGLPPPKPALIGDQARARWVLANGVDACKRVTFAGDLAEQAIARLAEDTEQASGQGQAA